MMYIIKIINSYKEMLKETINIIRKINRQRNYIIKDLKLLILSFKIKKLNSTYQT
jgi:hypothetical protein